MLVKIYEIIVTVLAARIQLQKYYQVGGDNYFVKRSLYENIFYTTNIVFFNTVLTLLRNIEICPKVIKLSRLQNLESGGGGNGLQCQEMPKLLHTLNLRLL